MATKRTSKVTASKSVREAHKGQSAKIQAALYQIADAASAVTDMPSFYKKLHQIVGSLMYAKNFFIALYDEESDLISWPYHADVKDTDDVWGPQPMADYRGGTAYLLRNGRPLWMTRDYRRMLKSGQFEQTGPTSADFIGIPLKGGNKILGALVVQSYTSRHTYTKQDVEILAFVAQHISTALTRARAIEETRKRNLEIAEALEQQTATSEILRVIANSPTDVQPVFDAIVERAVKLCGGFAGFAYRVIDDQIHLVAQYNQLPGAFEDVLGRFPVPLEASEEESNIASVIRNRTVFHSTDMKSDLRLAQSNRDLGTRYGVGANLWIPLVKDERGVGAIFIGKFETEPFTEKQIALVQMFADQAVIAIENVRLFTETQRLLKETEDRAAELAIINRVQEGLASKLDIQAIYDLVGDKIRTIFDAQVVTISTYGPETGIVTPRYCFEKGQLYQAEPYEYSEITSYLVRERQALVIHTMEEFEKYGVSMVIPVVAGTGISKSAVYIPLVVGDQTHGHISLQNIDRENAFNESDVRLLATLANSMSVALENARLFDEVQKRNQEITEALERQTATSEILSVIASSPTDIQPVFDAIIERATKLCDGFSGIAYRVVDGKIYLVSQYNDDPQAYQDALDVGPISLDDPENESNIAPVIRNCTVLHMPDVKNDPHVVPFNRAMAERYGIGASLFIPLVKDNKGIGVLSICRSETRPFTEQQIALVQTFADQAVIAIENVRLFTETQRLLKETEDRAAELAILNSVGEAMAKTLDVKTVTRIVGNKVRDIFSADQIGILLFDKQTNLLRLIYGYDKAHDRYVDDLQIKPIPLGQGLTSKVIELRQPLLLNTREEQAVHGHYMPPELKGQIKTGESWLGVPIIVDEEALGVVAIEDYRPHVYNENHLRLLQILSSNMGVAIQNASLFDEAQQRNAELAIINSVQEGLASKLEMQGIYDLVGDKVREIFDANTVTLVTFDLDKNILHPRYAFEKGRLLFIEPTPISEIYMDFIRRGQPLLVNNRLVEYFKGIDPGFKPLAGETPMSALAVPLTINGEMRGLISLQNIDRENAFSESDMRLLQTLANSMSVALENARLWEQEKMYRKALQRELDIGREIQAGFLPEELPRVDGWEIAASLMSAREVAGDFYDAFELPDGTIGLVIADVCDKGVGAALFMTLFRSLIRAAANLDYFEHTQQESTPHSAAERLQRAMSLTNNYIAETHGESGMFATLFFGILDPRDGRLAYINGGHEPPLIVQTGTVRETLRKTGPAVGAIPNCRFEILETQLQAGDTFFAFTDGVPDCQNPRDEFFGRERLLDFLQQRNGSAPELIAEIESELRQYIASANQFDDITLLAVRRA